MSHIKICNNFLLSSLHVQSSKSKKDISSYFLVRYVSLVYHLLYILTCSAEPRTRSELRHIDDFYGKNLPGLTMNALPNDAEWSPATMRVRRQH